jgi:tRNA(Ile)-lysidine synthase
VKDLLDEPWVERLRDFNRLMVAFSGGLDSTVLLHALAMQPELAHKLCAVHIHHGLSPHASGWQQHVEHFCEQHRISLVIHHLTLSAQSNIEEEARLARLRVFDAMLDEQDGLLLAHHQDDQAETLLLQLCRGSGVDGLSGVPSQRALGKGQLLRPFLALSKKTLKAYAVAHQLRWVDDESNADVRFSRNLLRHQILPLLQKQWPAVVQSIATCASHCQQARSNLEDLARMDCSDLAKAQDFLDLLPLAALNDARLSNVLRVWLMSRGARAPSTSTVERLLHEVIRVPSDKMPCVQWGAFEVRRYRQRLYFRQQQALMPASSREDWPSFPSPWISTEGGAQWVATVARRGLHVPLGSRVEVAYRVGGETLVWRGKTRILKKLFQQWGVPPWLRQHVPLIYVDGDLALVLDFCVSDRYDGAQGERVFQIDRSEKA